MAAAPPIPRLLKKLGQNGCNGVVAKAQLAVDSFLDLLPGSGTPAISSTDGRLDLTHKELKDFVTSFSQIMHTLGVEEKTRIGVVLPNGPEAGVAILCTMSMGVCCPANAQSPPEEIISDLLTFSVPVVITLAASSVNGDMTTGLVDALADAGLVVLELHPNPTIAGLFSLKRSSRSPIMRVSSKDMVLHNIPTKLTRTATGTGPGRNAWILLLHTSGTSGKKKVVPFSLETVAIGAACVAASWQLSCGDVCLNMMPLFHSGGIVRNLLAPIMAGGSAILCPGFDAALFWDSAPLLGATWYYASPTMHSMIVAEVSRRGRVPKHSIRLIGNAAGPLLPSLAEKLQDTFGHQTVILPSYGMTECMPITTPPLNYKLSERIGTSGRSVGPEISIRNDSGTELPGGIIGNICVRGTPTFHGYEDPKATRESMFSGGWFNTGDLGYMDSDGYLYITGRSKEVINRGGELISPVEVEDAILRAMSSCLSAVMAISAPHDALQEVVGIVVTMVPGAQRPSLKMVQDAVSTTLHPSKWPQVLVFMDNGLPMNNGKLLRVNMAKRLSLPELKESTPETERLFEATWPPSARGAALQTAIPCSPMDVQQELNAAANKLCEQMTISDAILCPRSGVIVAFVVWSELAGKPPSQTSLHHRVVLALDGNASAYVIPSRTFLVQGPIERGVDGNIDHNWLQVHWPSISRASATPWDDVQTCIGEIFAEVLGIDPQEVGLEDDFFAIGGDSFRAGKATAALRREFPLPLLVSNLYQCKTVEALAALVKAKLLEEGRKLKAGKLENHIVEKTPLEPLMKPFSPTAPLTLLIQALPLVVIVPGLKIATWTLFVYFVTTLRTTLPNIASLEWDVFILVAAGMLAGLVGQMVLPLLSIMFKWLVIGSYKEGVYPTFSGYYLRWWFVDRMIQLSGRGFFEWNDALLPWYYRLMGAKIGCGVLINGKTKIKEFDLVTIGNDCLLDDSTVSPFGLKSGCFELRPIVLGARTIMSPGSVAVPGSVVREDGYFHPSASTYDISTDIADRTEKEWEALRSTARIGAPKPHPILQMILGMPVVLSIHIIARLPVLFAIYGMIKQLSAYRIGSLRTMEAVFVWFAVPNRFPWYIIVTLANALAVPLLRVSLSIAFKRLVLGRFKEGPRTHSQGELLRYWFTEMLLSKDAVHSLTLILGANQPTTGWVLRLMGAQVGQRIFWPGSMLDIIEYDLLKVEDDVVFGSRSKFFASNGLEAKQIVIDKGSMVSDRCIMFPGSEIGRNAILGSGTVTPFDFKAPGGSIWLGNGEKGPIIWREGSAEAEAAETLSPYGRAFFNREANYFVWPWWLVLIQNILIRAFAASFWVLPILGILYFAVDTILYNELITSVGGGNGKSGVLLTMVGIMFAVAIPCYLVSYIMAFFIEIGSKWLLIGRRTPGRYNWDTSSYNQRWKLHKQLQSLHLLRGTDGMVIPQFMQGSQYLVWYFRALGARIGERVCLYPNGADPMMTEPDLVTIGDMASIDEASLVAHINSKGIFDLNTLSVGRGCVMRRNTRLLSGAAMEDFSTMLEHTLVVSGDALGAGTTWQGWPAHMLSASKSPDLETGQINMSADAALDPSMESCDSNPDLVSISVSI